MARIPQDELERLKRDVDLADLVTSSGVTIEWLALTGARTLIEAVGGPRDMAEGADARCPGGDGISDVEEGNVISGNADSGVYLYANMARSEKNVPLLIEQFSNAASKENASHQARAFCHGLKFSAGKLFEFVFVLCLVACQFVVLEVVPDLFIGIPVW